jgi:hypothetical protein
VLEARAEASMSFDPERRAIVGFLPATSARHLKDVANALREPVLQGLVQREAPDRGEEQLRGLLASRTVTLLGRKRLDYLLRDLGREAGVFIGFDPKQVDGPLPYIKLAYDKAPLRQVLRDIVDEAGFDGCSVEPPAGLWLYKGPRPYPSAEILWDSIVVRAYDLTALMNALTPDAAALLTGDTIVHLIRSRVFPKSWSDPGTAVFYHALTRKLVVIHAPQAQRQVIELLNDIQERGYWALE